MNVIGRIKVKKKIRYNRIRESITPLVKYIWTKCLDKMAIERVENMTKPALISQTNKCHPPELRGLGSFVDPTDTNMLRCLVSKGTVCKESTKY